MSSILDPPPREPTLEQHMIEFEKVTAASLNSAIGPNKKYLILQGNKVAQIFIKNAFEFFERHFPNKNPHILTARCLQINVTAVRRFKTGPTEKTVCQKPYTKKSKPDDNVPKSKDSKNKKSAETIKNETSALKQENTLVVAPKPVCTQQNISYQSGKGNLQEQTSFISTENREFNSLQVPIFPLASQNSGYPYTTSGKHMSYSDQNSILSQDTRRLGTIGTLPKPPVPDIFHLSPEPQYGAPSVAVAPSVNQKNNLTDLTHSPTSTFQHIKMFGHQQGGYQYANPNVLGNNGETETKDQDSVVLQKQYEPSKFNFENVQNSYKY